MAAGVTIDYRLKVRGVPMKWRSLISEWDPPHAFTDEQLRGPYRQWIHRHSFAALDEHSTRVTDTVRYRPPFGRLANWLLVERDVRQIFEYRTAFLVERFGVVGGAPVSE
jgi:ligand-binding SRPBCC domain-containing protein